MQKKQDDEVGEIQKFPIWHFILDYDGYANSDKRYRTKYHDDIPELEEKFDGAVKLAKLYETDIEKFEIEKHKFEREVNDREKEEGLWGMKYGYVEIERINEENFYNLLSEFHLRPVILKRMKEKEFDDIILQKINDLQALLEVINNSNLQTIHDDGGKEDEI